MKYLAGLFLFTLAYNVAANTAGLTPAKNSQPEAPNNLWQTIEPGGKTSCSDGSAYRFHVKQGDPDKLFLFYNGGGACWNAQTCAEGKRRAFVPRADLPHNDPRNHDGVFNLEHPNNPLKDWTMVFAAYCTGDVHLGSRTMKYTENDGQSITIKHNGLINGLAVMDWVTKSLKPKQVVVSGASAGALSSPYYAMLAAQHYPQADIVHFSGGGSGYQSPKTRNLLNTWNAYSLLEGDEYKAVNREHIDIYSFFNVDKSIASRIRYSLYDTAFDSVQITFLKLLNEPITLQDAINKTYGKLNQNLDSVSTYLGAGDVHTILRRKEFYSQTVGKQSFLTWFTILISGKIPPNVDCQKSAKGCVVIK